MQTQETIFDDIVLSSSGPAGLRRRAGRHRAMARLIGDEQASQALGAVGARDEKDVGEAERQAGEWNAARGGR
jgi:hypothetical protein